ncbi:MAG TPA: Xaa-Pro peptidase family protein [Microthrixaceae bacterium]|nr:Xaa-Pro peptidase family protein [Microthrixaceae bacterium]
MPDGSNATSDLVPMDVAGRLGRLRERFDVAGVDALIVTAISNVRYLTGFTGSAGLVVVTTDRAALVTDGRYAGQAPSQLAAAGSDIDVEVSSDAQDGLVSQIVGGSARVGLEADSIVWSAQQRYERLFDGRQLVATRGVVESLRIRKDAGEVDRMARAAAIADAALAEVRAMLLDRPSEAEFALALDTAIRRHGASGNSFETIVASGPNGALPHARPTERTIADGDLVVLDFGAVVDGYCSDMTRTVAIGDLSDTQARMAECVTAAQRAGVAAVRSGATSRDVDRACRDVIDDYGWSERFTHGTGHGVGLDIHEAPRVSSASDATLEAGFVVTVEPGVYIDPHGGVRVEDTVVVTDTGCTVLTKSPKSLSVVG